MRWLAPSALLSILLTGCFSMQPSRGRLSDRMDKAADTTSTVHSDHVQRSGDRHDDRDDDPFVRLIVDILSSAIRESSEPHPCSPGAPSDWPVQVYDSASAPPPLASTPPSNDANEFWLSFIGGGGMVAGPQTQGLPYWGFRGSLARTNGIEYSLELNAGHSDPIPNARLDRATNGISLVLADARVSYLLTPRHTFMGAYMFGGLGYGLQWWQYSDGGSDAVDGIDIFGGVGVNFVQTSYFRFGFEARPGFVLYMPKTMNGYDNNVFGAMTYVKLGPTISVRF